MIFHFHSAPSLNIPETNFKPNSALNNLKSVDAQRYVEKILYNYKKAHIQPFFVTEGNHYVPNASYLGLKVMGPSRGLDMEDKIQLNSISELDDSIDSTLTQPNDINTLTDIEDRTEDLVLNFEEVMKNVNRKLPASQIIKLSKPEDLLNINDVHVLERLSKIPLYRVDDPCLRKAIRRAAILQKRGRLAELSKSISEIKSEIKL